MIGYSTTVIEKMKEMQCQCHCFYDIPRYVTMDYVWGLSSQIFQSHGDVTIAGEGLQILAYAWHSWPLSSEGSLACPHLLWYRASVYIIVISEYRDTHTYCRAFSSGAVTTLGLSRLGFEHPTFNLRGQRSNPLRHCHGSMGYE